MKRILLLSMVMVLTACGGGDVVSNIIIKTMKACNGIGDTLTFSITANPWGNTVTTTCTTIGTEPKEQQGTDE